MPRLRIEKSRQRPNLDLISTHPFIVSRISIGSKIHGYHAGKGEEAGACKKANLVNGCPRWTARARRQAVSNGTSEFARSVISRKWPNLFRYRWSSPPLLSQTPFPLLASSWIRATVTPFAFETRLGHDRDSCA